MTTNVKNQILEIISKHLDHVNDLATSMQINVNLEYGTISLEDFRKSKGLLNIDLDVIKF